MAVMNRRGFLRSILAAGVAPYVVTTAGVLMPVHALYVPSRKKILLHLSWSAEELVKRDLSYLLGQTLEEAYARALAVEV